MYEDVNNKCRLSYPDSWLEERPLLLVPIPVGELLVNMCVHIFNLRSSHLRLTLGHAHLCSFILLCASQHRWLNAIGQKKAPPHSLAIT
jgi:hypothetical protein